MRKLKYTQEIAERKRQQYYENIDVMREKGKNYKRASRAAQMPEGWTMDDSLSKGEFTTKKWLERNNIRFESEKAFDGCKNKNLLKFDFWLPDYNIVIEYQGKGHYFVIDYWGGEEGFKSRQKCDAIKKEYCKANNITLLEIKYTNFDKIEEILKEQLLTIPANQTEPV